MPTSKHRKKHKAKSKQRRNEIAQKKSAQNKKTRQYEAQIEALNKQFNEHIASGGKPEDFLPLQQILGGVPKVEPVTAGDIEDAVVVDDDDDGALYGGYTPENVVEEVKNDTTE